MQTYTYPSTRDPEAGVLLITRCSCGLHGELGTRKQSRTGMIRAQTDYRSRDLFDIPIIAARKKRTTRFVDSGNKRLDYQHSPLLYRHRRAAGKTD